MINVIFQMLYLFRQRIDFRLFLGGILLMISSCKKDELKWNLPKFPEISDVQLIHNDLTSFFVSASCLSDGYDDQTEMGFCWSYQPEPTINDQFVISGKKGTGLFQESILRNSSLPIYVRAFARNKVGLSYSDAILVNWPGNATNFPTIQTVSVNNISFTSFVATGNLVSNGGLQITEKGILVSTIPNPSLAAANYVLTDNNGNGSYILNFSGLQDNTVYYVRAFATNLAGTSYGSVVQVQTKKIYSIGETGPAGGIIIYQNPVSGSNWNYLEAAPIDANGLYPWTSGFTQTGITDLEIGAGFSNTNDIVFQNGPGSNYAAGAANNWVFAGFSDWYLPSMKELKLIKELMYDQGQGSLMQEGTYWSSSEDSNYPQNAWSVKMTSGLNQIITQGKNINNRVRPIRRF